MNKSQYNKKLCNKWITVKSNGKSKSAYIVDECPGCKKGSLGEFNFRMAVFISNSSLCCRSFSEALQVVRQP